MPIMSTLTLTLTKVNHHRHAHGDRVGARPAAGGGRAGRTHRRAALRHGREAAGGDVRGARLDVRRQDRRLAADGAERRHLRACRHALFARALAARRRAHAPRPNPTPTPTPNPIPNQAPPSRWSACSLRAPPRCKARRSRSSPSSALTTSAVTRWPAPKPKPDPSPKPKPDPKPKPSPKPSPKRKPTSDQVADAGCMPALCVLLASSKQAVQAAALALTQELCSSRHACLALVESGAASPPTPTHTPTPTPSPTRSPIPTPTLPRRRLAARRHAQLRCDGEHRGRRRHPRLVAGARRRRPAADAG